MTCGYGIAWQPACDAPAYIPGGRRCEYHVGLECFVCGQPATRECGRPLEIQHVDPPRCICPGDPDDWPSEQLSGCPVHGWTTEAIATYDAWLKSDPPKATICGVSLCDSCHHQPAVTEGNPTT